MSDNAISLLEAIDTELTTLRLSGGTLEDIRSHFVLFTATDTPPEFGSRSPMCLVSMGDVQTDVISLDGSMQQKTYPVNFSIFCENAGDTRKKVAAQLIDLVETAFFGQTFSCAEWVELANKNYRQSSIQGFSGDWTGSAELVNNYVHIDVRGVTLPIVRPRTVSPDMTIIATDTLSCYYDTLRIQGDCTMISTPTIQAGVDGQRLTIFGLSDSAMPTIQDELILPGSTLVLLHRRAFTLGKNDSITFEYNGSQSTWVEVTPRMDLS